LATRDGAKRASLWIYISISSIRAIWTYQSASACIGVDPEQYRRGIWQVHQRRIPAVPGSRERLELRIADAAHFVETLGFGSKEQRNTAEHLSADVSRLIALMKKLKE
jgi:hypothetical protein